MKRIVIKNPYKSQAQRRKFHAMAERGEISQATVDKYDRESEGLDLPERVGNPNGTWLHNYAKKEWYYIVNGIHIGHIYFQDKLYSASVYPDGNVGVYKSILRAKAAVEKHAKELTHTPYRNPRKRQTMRERCEEMLHGKEQEPTFSYYRDVENPSFTKHGRKTFSIPVDDYSSWRRQLLDIANRSVYAGTPQLGFDSQKRLLYGTKQALTDIIKTLVKREREGAKEIWGEWRDNVYSDDQRKQFYELESLISTKRNPDNKRELAAKKDQLLAEVRELSKKHKRLYGDMDISSPMSSEEKASKALISEKFSEINKIVKQIRGQRNPDHKKRFAYKGFTCIWNKEKDAYDIFTKDEMEQPAGMRYPDFEMETEQGAKEWIDSYDDF